jgi:hypothetical protein
MEQGDDGNPGHPLSRHARSCAGIPFFLVVEDGSDAMRVNG